MLFRLTVVDSDLDRAGAAVAGAVDVEVVAAPTNPVSSLLAALPIGVAGRPCYVGATPLDPAAAIADSPLLHGAVLSVGAPGPDPRRLPAPAAGAIRILDGPCAGSVEWLPPGVHSVARDPAARVAVRDPRVSRRHALLNVTADGQASVVDAGSEHGTTVDGRPVGDAPVPVPPGAVVTVGASRLRWTPLPAGATGVPGPRGARLEFDRRPDLSPIVSRQRVTLPAPVENPARNWATLALSAGAPVALGLIMALVFRQPAMLLFALLAPLATGGQQLIERRGRRQRSAQYAVDRCAAATVITGHLAGEEHRRRAQAPDPLDVLLLATGATDGLWRRRSERADALLVSLGVHDAPATLDVDGEPWAGWQEPVVRAVPATADLREIGVLGLVGSPAEVAGVARWLLVQLATLNSPDELRLVYLAAPDRVDGHPWLRWLPHLEGHPDGPLPCHVGTTDDTRAARVDELADLIAHRREHLREHGGPHGARFTPEVVAVLDGALTLRTLPRMKDVLDHGPRCGVYAVCIDTGPSIECRAVLGVDPDGLAHLQLGQRDRTAFRPEAVTAELAETVARAVAPMRDRVGPAASGGAIPYPVRYLDLLDVHRAEPGEIIRRWAARPGPTTRVPLGAGVDGQPVAVDLAAQGPHAILGGATGAGKSMLLQTFVTALLLHNRPDELNLVLVDFKGGAAFLPFARCPHVVGLIRSTGETAADVFDEAAARRLLASVRAEVNRRESVLSRYGAEIDRYWQARATDPALPALPRLVLVFDEYARVLETSPRFLAELVNVAAKGRSLGMHLVLATQSMQGKLSDELKNNISLRLTLRQNEPADSTEILGVPDAAGIPGRLRGRAMLLCTLNESRVPLTFQSGYLGDPPPADGRAPTTVRVAAWPALGEPRPDRDTTRDQVGATDLDLTITAIERSAADLGVSAPFRPLRPALAARIPLADLPTLASAPVAPAALAYGLIDEPEQQAQPAAVLDLARTDRLLVAGSPQSGRSTVARTLTVALARRFGPDEAHVYLIEHQPGALADLADLPHCGALLHPAEPDRIRRLVEWLRVEVDRRPVRTAGAADPYLVLIVDGWEYFENRADAAFQETSVLVALRDIARLGPPRGVHLVVLGTPDLLSSRLAEMYNVRLLLPFAKEETRRSHLPPGTVSPPALPGRAVDAATGRHVQVCQAESDAVAAAVRAGAGRRVCGPRRFPSLPVDVRLEDLRLPDPPPSASWVPLGLGGTDVGTVGVDLFDLGPHLLLISGPEGSGRTAAAATMVHALRGRGIGVVVLAPPRSPLPGLLPVGPGVETMIGTSGDDALLRAAVDRLGTERYAVVLDDGEQLTVAPTKDGWDERPTLLDELSQPGALGRGALILAGDARPILSGHRRALQRVVTEMATSGTRLVLTPQNRSCATEHGLALDHDQYLAGPPGRGYLVTAGRVALTQVALTA